MNVTHGGWEGDVSLPKFELGGQSILCHTKIINIMVKYLSRSYEEGAIKLHCYPFKKLFNVKASILFSLTPIIGLTVFIKKYQIYYSIFLGGSPQTLS